MSYTKSAVLPVSPDEAFALVTDPERLRRWQVVAAYVDLRAGGEYRWTVSPGHTAGGTFKEIEPGRRVVYGWGWVGDNDLPPDASTVTITLEPTDGGTRVTLEHDGLTEQQSAMHAEGWDHYFERLDKLVTAGDAGPDEWAWAPEHLDPVVASEAVLAVIQPVLRGLTAEDQPKATPCPDFTCHELAMHLMGSMTGLGAMAGATIAMPEEGSLEHKVSTMAEQAIHSWRSVDLSGTVRIGGGHEMPAAVAAGILPVVLALHGWDLAQASGQELRISDEVVAYLRELAEVFVPGGRSNGSFGEEVEPAADASAIDRLAAYAGRRPLVAA